MATQSSAPVCHVSPPVQIANPPVSRLPTIPTVQSGDWASLIAALKALTLGYQMLSGQLAARDTGITSFNGRGPGNPNGTNNGGGKGGTSPKPPSQKPSRFTQTGQSVATQTFTSADGNVSIDVQQTTSITMVDNVTGQSFTISAGA